MRANFHYTKKEMKVERFCLRCDKKFITNPVFKTCPTCRDYNTMLMKFWPKGVIVKTGRKGNRMGFALSYIDEF